MGYMNSPAEQHYLTRVHEPLLPIHSESVQHALPILIFLSKMDMLHFSQGSGINPHVHLYIWSLIDGQYPPKRGVDWLCYT